MKYHESSVKVRFCEVDAYRVAWHGHYAAWMEIGRSALARQFGMDPFQIAELGFLGPVISLEIRYFRPARCNDEIVVKTRLLPGETATLIFESLIVDQDGRKLATGVTTHALTDLDGVLQFRLPDELEKRITAMRNWLVS